MSSSISKLVGLTKLQNILVEFKKYKIWFLQLDISFWVKSESFLIRLLIWSFLLLISFPYLYFCYSSCSISRYSAPHIFCPFHNRISLLLFFVIIIRFYRIFILVIQAVIYLFYNYSILNYIAMKFVDDNVCEVFF